MPKALRPGGAEGNRQSPLELDRYVAVTQVIDVDGNDEVLESLRLRHRLRQVELAKGAVLGIRTIEAMIDAGRE